MTVVANALLAQSYRAQDTMALRESFIMLCFSNRPSVELRIHDKPKPPKHQDRRTQASRKYYTTKKDEIRLPQPQEEQPDLFTSRFSE